jgi:hypothetical protein
MSKRVPVGEAVPEFVRRIESMPTWGKTKRGSKFHIVRKEFYVPRPGRLLDPNALWLFARCSRQIRVLYDHLPLAPGTEVCRTCARRAARSQRRE